MWVIAFCQGRTLAKSAKVVFQNRTQSIQMERCWARIWEMIDARLTFFENAGVLSFGDGVISVTACRCGSQT
jgi:hypothetical protein